MKKKKPLIIVALSSMLLVSCISGVFHTKDPTLPLTQAKTTEDAPMLVFQNNNSSDKAELPLTGICSNLAYKIIRIQ